MQSLYLRCLHLTLKDLLTLIVLHCSSTVFVVCFPLWKAIRNWFHLIQSSVIRHKDRCGKGQGVRKSWRQRTSDDGRWGTQSNGWTQLRLNHLRKPYRKQRLNQSLPAFSTNQNCSQEEEQSQKMFQWPTAEVFTDRTRSSSEVHWVQGLGLTTVEHQLTWDTIRRLVVEMNLGVEMIEWHGCWLIHVDDKTLTVIIM